MSNITMLTWPCFLRADLSQLLTSGSGHHLWPFLTISCVTWAFSGLLHKLFHMVIFCFYGPMNTGLGATLGPSQLPLIASHRVFNLNIPHRHKSFRLQHILREEYDSHHKNISWNHPSYWLGLANGWNMLLFDKLERRHWNRPQIPLISVFHSGLPLLLLPKTIVLPSFTKNIPQICAS